MGAPDKVLITGGAGFIGSHLAEAFLAEGRQVVVLDSFDDFYDPAIKRRNIAQAETDPAYTLVEGDLRDQQALESLFSVHRPQAVVHLAARAGVRYSIENPVLYSSVNLDGTTRLLEASRRHGVERFVFGSSSSVYGNNEKVPFSEDDPVDHPVSPYAATKRAGELICHSYYHLFGLPMACLRFFTVYGPRQRPEMAIHRFARRLAAGRPILQYGDGSSERDYTFIEDIIDGIRRSLEQATDFHIWNLGGSRTISLSQLASKIADGLGVPLQVEVAPAQPGDVDRTWADVRRAERELGWSPRVDIDAGLGRFLAWFRQQRTTAPACGEPGGEG